MTTSSSFKPIAWVRDGSCIICTSHSNDLDGYPRVQRRNKKQMKLARLVLFGRYGEQPSSVNCRHTCDQRNCINPDHIIPGSNLDNRQDMVTRGRSADTKGERNGFSKLTTTQILEIRADKVSSLMQMSKKYGVSRSLIYQVQHGLLWKHVNGAA